jgi:hypothetical protein
MMSAGNICFYYLFIALFLFGTCYYTGHSVFKLFFKSGTGGFYRNIFVRVLTGAGTLVVLVSMVYTGGRTIHFVLPELLLLYFFESRFNTMKLSPAAFKFRWDLNMDFP